MAYFANGMEGGIFDEQCAKCKYGDKPCPIAMIQMTYNYDQLGSQVAIDIMNALVSESGVCSMRDTFRKDFASDGSKQKSLF